MQFHELAFSSFIRLSSSQEFGSACFSLIFFFKGHLEKMSALHDSQMYDVNKRLEAIERALIDKMQETDVLEKLESVLSMVKEGAEGNT